MIRADDGGSEGWPRTTPRSRDEFIAVTRREHELNPAFRNAEWVATQCEPRRALFEVIKARVAKLAEARAAAAQSR
jgi:hypothetical protein